MDETFRVVRLVAFEWNLNKLAFSLARRVPEKERGLSW